MARKPAKKDKSQDKKKGAAKKPAAKKPAAKRARAPAETATIEVAEAPAEEAVEEAQEPKLEIMGSRQFPSWLAEMRSSACSKDGSRGSARAESCSIELPTAYFFGGPLTGALVR